MARHQCQYCVNEPFVAPSEQLLMRHVRLIHSCEPGFRISCKRCHRMFKNFRTYQNHLLTHKADSHNDTDMAIVEETEEETGHEERETSLTLINESTVGPSIEAETTSNALELTKYCAQWILKISETRHLTRVATVGIVEDASSLIREITLRLQTQVLNFLQMNQITIENDEAFSQIFSYENPTITPFSNLITFNQQLSYYRRHFNLIEPIRIVLDESRFISLGRKNRTQVRVMRKEILYVPLLKTLEVMLSNKSIQREVTLGHKNDSIIMSDFCDGSRFTSHPLFSFHPQSLQLCLYYDELELCNPLGSKRTKHKIGAFYFILGNISPKLRQQLSSIQLLALVKSSVVKEFGMNHILEHLLPDIKKLETGMNIKGISWPVRGTISVCSADNLGSQELGGYKMGGSSFRMCRHCLGTEADIQSKFLEYEFQLRTPLQYNHHCHLIEDNADLASHYSTTFGINHRSALNSLSFFNVSEGSLLPDIMHDILEGVLPLVLKLMLKNFVCESKLLTLNAINDGFTRLNLQYMDNNVPTPLASNCLDDGSLKQNASQMWTLGRFLPLVIGHLIPEDNPHWNNYIRLLSIMNIVFAPHISKEDCSYLETLISDHHHSFKKLYPEIHITPKLHYMIHLPRLILEYGPMICHWTMRFESKHSYFKHLANMMGNFKNVCYSLSLRHQLYQCYLNLNKDDLPAERTEIGPGTEVLLPHCDFFGHEISIDRTRAYLKVNWAKEDGTRYESGACVILKMKEEKDITFGKILNVYLVDHKILLEIKILSLTFYNEHLNSFEVNQDLSQACLTWTSELHEQHVYGLYSQPVLHFNYSGTTTKYIILKYSII